MVTRDLPFAANLDVNVIPLENGPPRHPSTSDLLVFPLRSRLSVVALFPKASRNINGNSAASKLASARSETAYSISTAFIFELNSQLKGTTGSRSHSEATREQLAGVHCKAYHFGQGHSNYLVLISRFG